MKVFLIGIGYFPGITAGDKNFFFQLVPLFIKTGKVGIEIISINDQEEKFFIQQIGNYEVKIYNLKRPLHVNQKKFYKRINNKYFYRHRHRPYQEISEIIFTIICYKKFIKELIETSNINIVHFMDNFGLLMPYFKRKFPQIKFTYAPATYFPRGKFYNCYLKYSFHKLDKIFPLTKAYRQILSNLGIPDDKMEVIRWGPKVSHEILSREEKETIKSMYGCKKDNLVFLWSGWLQQIQENHFYNSIRVARKIVEKYQDVKFIFAFKPECYKEKYNAESEDRIHVITDVNNFGLLLESADIFFSPIEEKNSTVSPPLTWIEAMARGTPVLTTRAKGVEELILDGENGYIAEDFTCILEKIENIKSSKIDIVSMNARKYVLKNFNIEKIAKNYIKCWQEI